MDDLHVLVLSGRDAAILVGATGAFIAYPLRDAGDSADRRLLGDTIDALASKLGAQWRAALANADLDTRSDWASFDRTARADLQVEFHLSASELATMPFVLRASAREFRDRWSEFLAIAPGGLHKYSAEIEDLALLEIRLRAVPGAP